jgi:hypothetical protein
LDKAIYSFCKKRSQIYSRYFDDITISGEEIAPEHIDEIENIIRRNGFNLNAKKREFFGRNVDKIVNGILISTHGVSVTKSYKESIKDAYGNFVKDKTPQNERVFLGKAGFYLYINKLEAKMFLDSLK